MSDQPSTFTRSVGSLTPNEVGIVHIRVWHEGDRISGLLVRLERTSAYAGVTLRLGNVTLHHLELTHECEVVV